MSGYQPMPDQGGYQAPTQYAQPVQQGYAPQQQGYAPQQHQQQGYAPNPYQQGGGDPRQDPDLLRARGIMTNGLFECFDDIVPCILVYFVPCLVSGMIAQDTDFSGGFLAGCCCFCFVCGSLRSHVFAKSGAADQDPGCPINCLLHCFITTWCALAQEYRAVQKVKAAKLRGVSISVSPVILVSSVAGAFRNHRFCIRFCDRHFLRTFVFKLTAHHNSIAAQSQATLSPLLSLEFINMDGAHSHGDTGHTNITSSAVDTSQGDSAETNPTTPHPPLQTSTPRLSDTLPPSTTPLPQAPPRSKILGGTYGIAIHVVSDPTEFLVIRDLLTRLSAHPVPNASTTDDENFDSSDSLTRNKPKTLYCLGSAVTNLLFSPEDQSIARGWSREHLLESHHLSGLSERPTPTSPHPPISKDEQNIIAHPDLASVRVDGHGVNFYLAYSYSEIEKNLAPDVDRQSTPSFHSTPLHARCKFDRSSQFHLKLTLTSDPALNICHPTDTLQPLPPEWATSTLLTGSTLLMSIVTVDCIDQHSIARAVRFIHILSSSRNNGLQFTSTCAHICFILKNQDHLDHPDLFTQSNIAQLCLGSGLESFSFYSYDLVESNSTAYQLQVQNHKSQPEVIISKPPQFPNTIRTSNTSSDSDPANKLPLPVLTPDENDYLDTFYSEKHRLFTYLSAQILTAVTQSYLPLILNPINSTGIKIHRQEENSQFVRSIKTPDSRSSLNCRWGLIDTLNLYHCTTLPTLYHFPRQSMEMPYLLAPANPIAIATHHHLYACFVPFFFNYSDNHNQAFNMIYEQRGKTPDEKSSTSKRELNETSQYFTYQGTILPSHPNTLSEPIQNKLGEYYVGPELGSTVYRAHEEEFDLDRATDRWSKSEPLLLADVKIDNFRPSLDQQPGQTQSVFIHNPTQIPPRLIKRSDIIPLSSVITRDYRTTEKYLQLQIGLERNDRNIDLMDTSQDEGHQFRIYTIPELEYRLHSGSTTADTANTTTNTTTNTNQTYYSIQNCVEVLGSEAPLGLLGYSGYCLPKKTNTFSNNSDDDDDILRSLPQTNTAPTINGNFRSILEGFTYNPHQRLYYNKLNEKWGGSHSQTLDDAATDTDEQKPLAGNLLQARHHFTIQVHNSYSSPAQAIHNVYPFRQLVVVVVFDLRTGKDGFRNENANFNDINNLNLPCFAVFITSDPITEKAEYKIQCSRIPWIFEAVQNWSPVGKALMRDDNGTLVINPRPAHVNPWDKFEHKQTIYRHNRRGLATYGPEHQLNLSNIENDDSPASPPSNPIISKQPVKCRTEQWQKYTCTQDQFPVVWHEILSIGIAHRMMLIQAGNHEL